ncbi:acyltransferase family protein [Anaerococcus cruorum]|uniref:acyltransferase family protein n=1 Tax=Anaerococcus sp. WGS1596 TaxID=3366806 RepID=UPI00372D4FB4
MKIKGLDFLRVYAMILVLCYHYFPAALPGGFLGVSILFVISGFLISYHLIDELFETGNIDYKKFYAKRFVRIFPALLLMLFLSTLFIPSINNDYSVGFFDQFLAAFTFNYNFYEILRGGSYEGQFIRGIFMHTWSLAIEIHFYLIWPWVMGFIYKKSRQKRAVKRRFSDLFCKLAFT